MQQITPPGFTELSTSEARSIEGGTPLGIAAFLVSCFSAGFRWGYNTLGPAICD